MALKINCLTCQIELDEPGALLFSPPDEFDRADKIHLCGDCWHEVNRHLFDMSIHLRHGD